MPTDPERTRGAEEFWRKPPAPHQAHLPRRRWLIKLVAFVRRLWRRIASPKPTEDDFDTTDEWLIELERWHMRRRVAVCFICAAVIVVAARMFPRHQVQLADDRGYSIVVVHDRWTGTVTARYTEVLADEQLRADRQAAR
jgi:hypothetical protein